MKSDFAQNSFQLSLRKMFSLEIKKTAIQLLRSTFFRAMMLQHVDCCWIFIRRKLLSGNTCIPIFIMNEMIVIVGTVGAVNNQLLI